MILSSLRDVATAIIGGIVIAATCVMTYVITVGTIAVVGVGNTLLGIPYRLAGTVLEQKVQSRSVGGFCGDVLGLGIAVWVIPALSMIALPLLVLLVVEFIYASMRDSRLERAEADATLAAYDAEDTHENLTPAAA